MIRHGIATHRLDAKELDGGPLGSHPIVELATNSWSKVISSTEFHHLLVQLETYDFIYAIHLRVPSRQELAKRYLSRLARDGGLSRLKPKPWVHGLKYLCTDKLARSEQAWQQFETYLLTRYPGRAITMEHPT